MQKTISLNHYKYVKKSTKISLTYHDDHDVDNHITSNKKISTTQHPTN
jgi:hypothetical protein